MALTKCSECGKEVSSQAASCPNCGNPIKVPRKPMGCGTLLIVLVVGVIVLASLGKRDQPPPPTAEEVAQNADNVIMAKACREAESQVKARLKAPATAEFAGCFMGLGEYRFNIGRGPREVTVHGHVDAENSFGAKLRRQFVVTLHSSTDLDAGPTWDRAEVFMPE